MLWCRLYTFAFCAAVDVASVLALIYTLRASDSSLTLDFDKGVLVRAHPNTHTLHTISDSSVSTHLLTDHCRT